MLKLFIVWISISLISMFAGVLIPFRDETDKLPFNLSIGGLISMCIALLSLLIVGAYECLNII